MTTITSATVGLPVTDLDRAVGWYRAVFGDVESIEPVPGIVELRVGPIWIQLFEAERDLVASEVVTRFGVDDVGAVRDRLRDAGVAAGRITRVEEVVEFFDVSDPDGNTLSFYAELGSEDAAAD